MKSDDEKKAIITTGRVLSLLVRSMHSQMGALLQIVGKEELERIMSDMVKACIEADEKADKEARKAFEKYQKKATK